MQDTSVKMTEPPEPSIHCLVHLGWDRWEYPDFEASLRGYIDHIARSVWDVLIFVSEWQRCDVEQVYQRAHIGMMRNIFYFLSLYNGDGVGDQLFWMAERFPCPREALIDAIDKKLMKKEIYLWCEKSIDREKMLSLGNERRELLRKIRTDSWEYVNTWKQMHQLLQRERAIMQELDIAKLAEQALQDIWYLLWERTRTYRTLGNPGRFFRIYQYAQKRLWSERIREMFIADAERADILAKTPITHLRIRWQLKGIPTRFDEWYPKRSALMSDILDSRAANLVDTLSVDLSYSEYQKLMQTQPRRILESLGFSLTNETPLIF